MSFLRKKNIKIDKNLIIPILFLLITAVSLFIRFWDYAKLLNFFCDPPFYLHEVKDMVDAGKIKLIGPIVMSKMIMGRGFFTGPTFYYLLALLGISMNWNVVYMTGFFTLLWMATFILIFFWIRSHFGKWIAITLYALLSFYPTFIPYSRLMWNPHLILFFGVLFLWVLEKREMGRRNYLWAGILFGLGLSVHYSALLWGLIILYYLYDDLKRKAFSFRSWVLFAVGVILAEFPFMLFELRHNFYNLRTIIFQIRYFQLSAGFTFKLFYYFWFPTLPLLCKIYAAFLKRAGKISPPIVIFSQIFLIIFLLTQSLGSKRQAIFYPKGWNLKAQQKVVDLVINDNEKNFEVATTIDSDTRALELRWWLRQKNHESMSVEDYDKADVLYLVAPESRPPEIETVWEVRALRPFTVIFTDDLGEGLTFYKLVRAKLKI